MLSRASQRVARGWTGARMAPVMALAGASVTFAGCAGPGLKAGFDAPDPGARLHAIERAAETNDEGQIPNLVAMLSSDDPAARMLSIRVLERMTGQTHDYDYSAPRSEREEAIGRWRAWLLTTGRTESDMPADGDHWLVRVRNRDESTACTRSQASSNRSAGTMPSPSPSNPR